MSEHRLPPYRCALYREEAGTGNVFMAFSSDSTCSSNLHSATSGFETFSLSVVPSVSWPSLVDNSNCRFPSWSHGYWQHMYIEGNTLTYKDHSTFKTYTIRCLGPETATSDRFAVFARTQCGEEMYNCIWLKRRGVNVLEFQLGLQSRPYYNSTLCSDSNFEPKVWITQGRLERLQESPCPVAGEYAGVIPDAANLCARLSSDCRSPEIMYYTVSDCSGSEVYEGSRRRGRKRRQTGTRIYRINNPRSSTTSSPLSPIPDNTTIPNGSYEGNDQIQDSVNLHYSSLGPRYPTTYHIGSSSTTVKTVGTEDPYPVEEYDPWTFSKTHGLQHGNRTESNSYYGNNRRPAWTTESSHRTNSGWAGQDDSSNWNARYGPSGRGSKPNREWNSQSPSHSTYPGPGSDWQMNQRTGPNKDQNEYWEVTQRTPEYYPSGSRSQGYPNEYPQGSQRYPTSNTNQYPQGIPRNSDKYLGSGIQNDHNHRTENFPDSNRNQGLPHSGYAQGSQNLPENYSGDTRNQDFPQSTQKTIQTYSGTNGNQEAPHNEIPHSTQRTYENHFGSNTRNQGFPPKEYPTATQRIPEHFGGGNRNYESQQGNQRFPDNYSGTNRNQGFRQTEHPQTTRTYENFPGKSGNQGYPSSDQSQPTQRSFENFPGPHTNKNIPQNSQPTQRSSGNNYHANNRNQVFQKEYPQRGYENYPSGNRNIGFPQRENSDQTQRNYAYPDGKQRYPQNDYSGARDVTRGDISPKPGPDSTVSTSAIGIRDRNRGATDPNGRFDSRHPWGPSAPHPVQLPPMPVERHRQGDRPSAVPRTAAPSKREEREYRCLGQWKEDGLMYTYTQRRDVGTYECFVGSIVSDNEIYIKEAGDHCQRDIDPMHNGMKLKRKGLCFGNHPGDGGNTGAGMPQPRPTTSWMSSRRPPEPTKPWKPITAPPKDSGGAESSKRFSPILFLVACSIVFFLQQ